MAGTSYPTRTDKTSAPLGLNYNRETLDALIAKINSDDIIYDDTWNQLIDYINHWKKHYHSLMDWMYVFEGSLVSYESRNTSAPTLPNTATPINKPDISPVNSTTNCRVDILNSLWDIMTAISQHSHSYEDKWR